MYVVVCPAPSAAVINKVFVPVTFELMLPVYPVPFFVNGTVTPSNVAFTLDTYTESVTVAVKVSVTALLSVDVLIEIDGAVVSTSIDFTPVAVNPTPSLHVTLHVVEPSVSFVRSCVVVVIAPLVAFSVVNNLLPKNTSHDNEVAMLSVALNVNIVLSVAYMFGEIKLSDGAVPSN